MRQVVSSSMVLGVRAIDHLYSPQIKWHYCIFLIFYTKIVLSVLSFLLCKEGGGKIFFLEIKDLKKKGQHKKITYSFPSWTLIYLKATQASLLLQSPGPVLLHPKALGCIKVCNGICFLLDHQMQKLVELRRLKEGNQGMTGADGHACEQRRRLLPYLLYLAAFRQLCLDIALLRLTDAICKCSVQA